MNIKRGAKMVKIFKDNKSILWIIMGIISYFIVAVLYKLFFE